MKASEIKALNNVTGCTFAGMTLVTEPKLNKKNRDTGMVAPFQIIYKVTERQVQIGYDYQSGVNNRLEKLGEDRDFVVAERTNNLKRVSKTLLTNNKGDLYLDCRIDNFSPAVVFYIDETGREWKFEEIKGWLPKVAEKNRQGLDQEDAVKVITPKLSSVRRLVFGDFQYDMRSDNLKDICEMRKAMKGDQS